MLILTLKVHTMFKLLQRSVQLIDRHTTEAIALNALGSLTQGDNKWHVVAM